MEGERNCHLTRLGSDEEKKEAAKEMLCVLRSLAQMLHNHTKKIDFDSPRVFIILSIFIFWYLIAYARNGKRVSLKCAHKTFAFSSFDSLCI